MERKVDIVSLISSSDMHISARLLLNYLSEDVEYLMLANHPDSPLLRQLRGKETVSDYLAILPMLYEIGSRTVNKVVQDGAHTVVMGRDVATIYPHRRKVSADWTAILMFQYGQIKRMQYIFHNMADAA